MDFFSRRVLSGHTASSGALTLPPAPGSMMARFSSVTMDTTHLGTWGLEPVDVYPRLNGRVRHVHLSNFDGKEHRRPEAGRLKLDRLLARLAAEGYQGAVSLEMSPDALDAGQADERVVELMENSLNQCRVWAGA
jgi:sugar phosphate isomerase/epimerase